MSFARANQIRQAFLPVEILDVIFCPLLDRAFVLVGSSEIGVARLLVPQASVKANCAIVVVTSDDLDERIDRAVSTLCQLSGLTSEQAERLVGEGVFSLNDVAQIAPARLAELCGMSRRQADSVIREAAQLHRLSDDAEE